VADRLVAAVAEATGGDPDAQASAVQAWKAERAAGLKRWPDLGTKEPT